MRACLSVRGCTCVLPCLLGNGVGGVFFQTNIMQLKAMRLLAGENPRDGPDWLLPKQLGPAVSVRKCREVPAPLPRYGP